MVVYKLGVGGEGDLVGEGGLFSVQEGVWEGGFELGDVENGVYPSELLWEADCNGGHAWGAYYLKRSQVLLHQFPRRSGCAEELRFYVYTIANPDDWEWYPRLFGS